MASLNALHSYRQVPTPTIAPSKPCNTCGHDHWGYTCNTLSDSEKLELYKKITRSQINRMKVIQLTNKVAKHHKKIEKKKALQELICTHQRAFALLVLDRLPANTEQHNLHSSIRS